MRKGFTLIELLAVIVILAIIALIATPIILGIINNAKKEAFKATTYGISKAADNAYAKMIYSNKDLIMITYSYSDGVELSDPAGYTLEYTGTKPKNGFVILNEQGKVSLMLHDGKWCASKDFTDTEITVEEKSLDDCIGPVVPIDISYANAPVLAKGMRAVIWDDGTSTWIDAKDPNDPYKQNWYNYEEKRWANAMTADGSMWVWIPRYAY